MKKILIFLALSLSLPLLTYASDWFQVSESIDHDIFYIEKSPPQITNNIIKVWRKTLTKSDPKIWYRLDLIGVNCTDESLSKPYQSNFYDKSGKFSASSSNNWPTFSITAPDTVGKSQVYWICTLFEPLQNYTANGIPIKSMDYKTYKQELRKVS